MKTLKKPGRLSGALLCVTMLAGLLSMTALAEGTGVAINATNFPDEKFREIVKEYDTDGDSALSDSEIELVKLIDCNDKGISSLKGIEFFTALIGLECRNNQLTGMDLSQNTALEELECDNNQLGSLDLSNNTALGGLYCSNNLLRSLDLSNNTALWLLDCSGNLLCSLDLSKNTALEDCGYSFSNNQYPIKLPENRIFNLSKLPGFDVSKASNWQGGTVEGNLLHINDEAETVTYSYYCGNNLFATFSLKLITDDVAIDAINFPDAAFREIVKAYDTDGDKVLSAGEIKLVTEIDCNDKGISSLKGIEFFTALEGLYCYKNQLASLDVSENTALEKLWCYDNQLTNLDVSENIAMKNLWCYENRLTSLDVSKNTALEDLDCCDNRLTNLDLSKNTALKGLGCYNNQLTNLDLSKNTALEGLDCSSNPLTNLDLSKNTALVELYCSENQLTNLDLSRNTALMFLVCSDNQLTNLDLSKNTALEGLECSTNQLTGLDVSKNTALEYLHCSANQLTSLDVSKNTALVELYCTYNRLTHLDMSKNIALEKLYCSFNELTKLDVSRNTALWYLYCPNNQLTKLDVSRNIALSDLICCANPITSLDVSRNIALQSLNCAGNPITSLDVSKNTALVELDCGGNQLTSLDVSKNTALVELYCDGNQLTSLDVSKIIALEKLYCYQNQLTSLDVSKNTALEDLKCNDNRYTIKVSENRIFDLSRLPGFDVNKASNWQGGTVDGNLLRVNEGEETVIYKYDCGKGYTATFILDVKVHTCVFDQKTIVEEALKTPADCTHDAVYYMSCECGEISTSEEETFTAKGTALGHKYRTAWSSDKTNHWHECSRCQDKKDEAAHTLETYVTPATMTKAGTAVTKCTICKEVTKTKTIAAIKTVKLSKTTYVYDGKTKTPSLTVKDSAGNTIASKYYKVEKSSGRKKVGKYTYKITFKGKYKGTKTLSFVINPKGTEIISLQAESKGFTARWKKQATQTTGYEIRYATNAKMDGAKTVKITKNSTVSRKITKLTAKKKYYVQIRTYKKINTATYKSAWSKTKTVTTKQ